ncbi:Hypothetical Protein RradSPS_0351 [Rubrobacter radiotolerans]|uniref:Uncharacterized protein n=1 Tax=Rubrobacter radiotolerans TaxID=42256 RepID=A0A023X0Q6_RUBRA|nr:hypothetical protein [Rubrobacter radiotolerans]AHY45634.1 Hypothetical Protein RradSPS_0351 [Rubrobacter radiotolerans]MDX5893048.1 hypothetical protein [Rubrobacter radiotolerans]
MSGTTGFRRWTAMLLGLLFALSLTLGGCALGGGEEDNGGGGDQEMMEDGESGGEEAEDAEED